MAYRAAVRVFETTSTTGTGTLSLAGAETQFRTFVQGIGTGNTAFFIIEDANGTDWEFSYGNVTDAATDTLTRNVIRSSNSNALVNLSAGVHKVYAINPPGFLPMDMDCNDLELFRAVFRDCAEHLSSDTISAGVLSVDFTQGPNFEVSHNANITSFAVTNPPASGKVGEFKLWLKQDATGGRTLTVSSAFRPDGGSAPALLTIPNAVNVLEFRTRDGGTKWQYKLIWKGLE